MVHLVLTSTYTNDILTLAFDPIAKTLDVVSSITVGHHPSWITFYPGDHSLVFTGLEQSDGKILALKYNEEGKGKVVAEASSGGADPCSLIATKTQLYVANVRFFDTFATRFYFDLDECSTQGEQSLVSLYPRTRHIFSLLPRRGSFV
jgi:6-phosphogluconolactonase (cycloisomerase 2 family)